MARKWELCIYTAGSAVLTDETGETVWASDDDDDFATEFDEALSFDDGDDIAEWLDDNNYLPEGVALEIVESAGDGFDDDSDEDDDSDDDEDFEHNGFSVE